jgi:hypothetical protein
MAEAATQASYGTLAEFLDSLPTSPCPSYPENRYYCSVCERLNKSTASRCGYSKLPDTDNALLGAEGDKSIQFQALSADSGKPESVHADDKAEKVEFKVVAPEKGDKDYPLFEFVQPKDKKIEPIEMELLEDVAVEFTTSEDEPVEVEALEVVPLDESESGEEETVEVMEVDVVEAVEFDDQMMAEPTGDSMLEFKPVTQPQPKQVPHKRAGPVPRKKQMKPVKKITPRVPVKKSKKAVRKPPRPKAGVKRPMPRAQAQPVSQPEPTWTPPPGLTTPTPAIAPPAQSAAKPKKRIHAVTPAVAPTGPTPTTQQTPVATRTPKKIAKIKKRPKIKK